MNGGLRVLCVTPSGRDGQGGIDRLYAYMRQHGWGAARDGIDVRFFAARGGAPGQLWVAAFPWRALLFFLRLAIWRPHIVHLNLAFGGSALRKYVLLRLSTWFGARTIAHFHGSLTPADAARPSPALRLFLAACRRADRVLALGEANRRVLVESVGLPAGQVVVMPNAVPDFAQGLALPKPRGEGLRLLFAGKICDAKGLDLLIVALGRLTAQSWTCTVAGHGDPAPYRAMAERFGVGDRIRFTGWLSAGETQTLMLSADAVVLPSRAEGLPMTLIEGACAGAALIATPVGEVPDVVVPGENGILVAPDAGDIARAIRTLCEDGNECAAMQVASRRLYQERFEIGAFASRLEALYRALAAERGAAAATAKPQKPSPHAT